MHAALDPVTAHAGTLAASTRRVFLADAATLGRLAFPDAGEPATALPWGTLGVGQGLAVRDALASSYAPGTANRMLSALRSIVRTAWRLGLMPWDAHRQVLDGAPRIKGGRVTKGRALEWPELTRLLDAAGGFEERALLSVLAGAGCRRAEALALTWDRVTRHDREFYLRILGKGNRERRVRLPDWAARDLRRWRTRCPEREAVFRWRDPKSVYQVVSSAAERAGLGRLAPHDLRRTLASLALAAGVDLPTLQRTMGHASIQTTVKYDHRSEASGHQVMARLDTGVPEDDA